MNAKKTPQNHKEESTRIFIAFGYTRHFICERENMLELQAEIRATNCMFIDIKLKGLSEVIRPTGMPF